MIEIKPPRPKPTDPETALVPVLGKLSIDDKWAAVHVEDVKPPAKTVQAGAGATQ